MEVPTIGIHCWEHGGAADGTYVSGITLLEAPTTGKIVSLVLSVNGDGGGGDGYFPLLRENPCMSFVVMQKSSGCR